MEARSVSGAARDAGANGMIGARRPALFAASGTESVPDTAAPPAGGPKCVLLLDISRLLWRAGRVGPTGIDRVELAYAEHFMTEQAEFPVYAVLHLFGFLFAMKSAGARRFITDLGTRWRVGCWSKSRRGHVLEVVKAYARLLSCGWIGGIRLRRILKGHPAKPIYMVVSHHHLSLEYALNRIRRKFKAQTVCLVHDIIPVTFPEYFPSGWDRRYRRLASNVARLFDGVIVNSEATACSLRSHLHTYPGALATLLNIRVALLGASGFPGSRSRSPSAQTPYFVVLGTVEPRKNHLLLLNIWARLASTVRTPPRLIVIGARGWENEQVIDMLERSIRLRGLVKEYNRLADAEIGALLRDACAILVPSFMEGFGLPLAEALRSNVPALCSDIPAFREVGGDVPEYLDPLDMAAWLRAILDYSQPGSTRRAQQMRRLADWHIPTWPKHFETTHRLLEDLSSCNAAIAESGLEVVETERESPGLRRAK